MNQYVLTILKKKKLFDETNDVMYRKLKALEDIEEDLGIDLFRYLAGLKRVLEDDK